MDLEESYTKWNQPEWGRQQHLMSLVGKATLRIQTQRVPKKFKEQGWIRRTGLTYTQKSVSKIDNPKRFPPFFFLCPFLPQMGFLVAQTVKNLPAMQGNWVQSLGQEDTQRRKCPPTPVFLPGEFHGQRSLGELQSMEWQRVKHDWVTNTFTFFLTFLPQIQKSRNLWKIHRNVYH